MKPVIYVLASDLQKLGKGLLTIAAFLLIAITFASIIMFGQWLIPGSDPPTRTIQWVAVTYGGFATISFFIVGIGAYIHTLIERSKQK
jgi:hypothetical protein